MGLHLSSAEIDAALKRTRRDQIAAADPQASVWVSANAGTGKTHVLTLRVLRLLLAGTPPERILCLTYTKAAAAEMSKRVFTELAKWVTAGDGDLGDALSTLLSRPPTNDERRAARTLFARAIETPGGLKVQTIHAFAERLLQRFPLEAGVTPGFSILDDDTAATLLRDAIDGVLARATRDLDSQLGRALDTSIAHAADDRFDLILGEALRHRAWLGEIPRLEAEEATGFEALDRLLRQHLGVRAGATRASIEAEMAALLTASEAEHASSILAEGSKRDREQAARLAAVHAAGTTREQARALADAFLTEKREPRAALMTNGLKAAHPDLEALLLRAQDRFVRLTDELRGAEVCCATLALSRLAEAVLAAYTEAKGRRAALDFDDLIAKTASLLATAASAEWVLYKLDGGLDHILVDESQDTSPEQWRIVEALVAEFFTGRGARDETRTLFAVGDEKQSIYSFQGAAPRMFAEMGERLQARAREAGLKWQRIPLDLSFRTVAPVLAAVDRVFGDPARTPGVPVEAGGLRHIARRIGRAGLVELWPTEAHAEAEVADAWSPLDDGASTTPVARLAARIADTIKGWLDTGERLASEDRKLSPGDILILVRKRNPFAAPMVAALKARGIPVAGADRMALTDQIAVHDLMALGDFLTLPEDDLSLAETLKSPFFGFDDDLLLEIANGRRGTLWSALLRHAEANAASAEAAETLKRWRRIADFSPPFEFFANLLDRDGGRRKLIQRLGPDAADPIDEFLNLALTYDDRKPASLTGFLTWLRAGRREVKRDMEHGRDEVRVMTVHGAKGLEAPVVFLPDTCSASSGGAARGGPIKLVGFPGWTAGPDAVVWPVKGGSSLAAISAAQAALADAEAEERDRLLYVAMTRARDRLYIAGFEGKRGREPGCWYDTIADALADDLTPIELPDGSHIRRLASDQTAEPEKPKHDLSRAEMATALPAWALTPAPREPQLAVPLAPSRLAPYEVDDSGEPAPGAGHPRALAEPAGVPPGRPSDQNRFLRGALTHALLEHLPALDPATWPAGAKAFVAARGKALPARTRASIVAETLAVLSDRDFAPLFGPGSRAEVPIVAEVARPRGSGPPLRLFGQIDRLAVTGDAVLVVDYKTNRPPPKDPAGIADVYLLQLAAYGLALRELWPRHSVRAAILWTDGPRLMEIPSDLLVTYQNRLWDLDPRRLDGS